MRASRIFGLIVIVAVAAALYTYRDSILPSRETATADRVDPRPAAKQAAGPIAVAPGAAGRAISGTPGAAGRPTSGTPGAAGRPTSGTPGAAGRPTSGTPGVAGGAPSTNPKGSALRPVPAATEEAVVEQAAYEFIETLTEAEPKPIPIDEADHFVVPEQVVSMASNRVVELLSLREIRADPTLGLNSPITLVKEVPQIEIMTPERIIAESGGDLEQPLKILEQEQIKELTVRKVLARHAADPGTPIRVIRLAEYLEPTTLGRLLTDNPLEWDTMVRVIRQPYRLESMTIADLLAGLQEIDPDSVFYVRTVRETDVQGVWGIIHDGLIKNFALGMAVRRGEEVNTYKVEIPRDADELLADRSSSFLGKLIDEKTRESTVYNFRLGRMTKNPDLVVPGSEILIVNFRPNELVGIYKHFLSSRG